METNKPQIALIADRAAVCSDAATELTLLVRVTPPQPEKPVERPLLNLGLVLDRSGSMSGEKLLMARQTATYAVQQLQPDDRVSVTIYDDEVETIVPSTPATNKAVICARIESVQCGGSTALHAGWVEGGVQVSRYLDKERLNRVLLLTDGLANVGETNADRIASDVRGLAQRGVSTSALGIGEDYDEDLILAVANSGDGNYYYAETVSQLPAIFGAELQGLMATFGHKVSLGLEPQNGVEVREVMNELEQTSTGRWMLSNLITGDSREMLVRLTVPAQARECDLLFVRLAWDDAQTGARRTQRAAFSLPVVTAAERARLAENDEVRERVAIMDAAARRKRAIAFLEAGDIAAAKAAVRATDDFVVAELAAMPASALLAEEHELTEQLATSLEQERHAHAAKAAKFHSYRRHRSR
jgi:Ca-activated chloride channel family protein